MNYTLLETSNFPSNAENLLFEINAQNKLIDNEFLSLKPKAINLNPGVLFSYFNKKSTLMSCSNIPEKEHLFKVVNEFIKTANNYKHKSIYLDLLSMLKYTNSTDKTEIYELIPNLLKSIETSLYSLPEGLKTKEDYNHIHIENVYLLVDDNDLDKANKSLEAGIALISGIKETKDLSNLPANIANSSYILEYAKSLTSKYPKISIDKIVDEEEMKHLNMGAFLAVNRASAQKPYLLILKYEGSPASNKTFGLLGKGLTFDSGGLSLKPSDSMIDMKYDMCGAASVIGTLVALATLDVPINVVGSLALAENMISANSYRPGDIITSMSGKTIQINNTDAEGRLVLADSLTYLQKNYSFESIIDIATLTGSIVIGLGSHHTGLFSNDENLANDLLKAGEKADDLAWRMPLHKIFHEQIKGLHCDIVNTGGIEGGACKAAAFLEEFCDISTKWVHLDIAGTSTTSGKNSYATARPVPLLFNYFCNKAKN